ncbi:MAG: DUF6054 family protein [Tissierellia bacterium]|nr:DUF6054 family protein [Tissierellia bacterium]
MAKLERDFKTDENGYTKFVEYYKNSVMENSFSASWEDGSSVSMGETKINVDVFERYSMLGENRVSLNVTSIYDKGNVKVIAVSSGGSRAIFFKLNTFGEEAFLEKFGDAIDDYIAKAYK